MGQAITACFLDDVASITRSTCKLYLHANCGVNDGQKVIVRFLVRALLALTSFIHHYDVPETSHKLKKDACSC